MPLQKLLKRTSKKLSTHSVNQQCKSCTGQEFIWLFAKNSQSLLQTIQVIDNFILNIFPFFLDTTINGRFLFNKTPPKSSLSQNNTQLFCSAEWPSAFCIVYLNISFNPHKRAVIFRRAERFDKSYYVIFVNLKSLSN